VFSINGVLWRTKRVTSIGGSGLDRAIVPRGQSCDCLDLGEGSARNAGVSYREIAAVM